MSVRTRTRHFSHGTKIFISTLRLMRFVRCLISIICFNCWKETSSNMCLLINKYNQLSPHGPHREATHNGDFRLHLNAPCVCIQVQNTCCIHALTHTFVVSMIYSHTFVNHALSCALWIMHSSLLLRINYLQTHWGHTLHMTEISHNNLFDFIIFIFYLN